MLHDVVEGALDERDKCEQLAPSIDVDTLRKIVRLTKELQLAKMGRTMISRREAERLVRLGLLGLSCAGVLLLAMPLVLVKKYPRQGKTLVTYSVLATLRFFVTVNLFGGLLMAMRLSQSALGLYANPALATVVATFDTLDHNANEYVAPARRRSSRRSSRSRTIPTSSPRYCSSRTAPRSCS